MERRVTIRVLNVSLEFDDGSLAVGIQSAFLEILTDDLVVFRLGAKQCFEVRVSERE
jgi:hypothetical protein